MNLTLTSLSCQRGGLSVIDALSVSVPTGTALVLRGPNGVGKTTLLRALAGLLPIAQGDVRIGDISLQEDPDTYQEHIAYSGHLDAVKSAFTVRENLAFWAGLFDGDTDPALEAFDLAEIAERRAVSCSAGQKRRLGLARLMVCTRKIWLLDEPTVSLDAENTNSFCAHVAKHCESGGCAVIATHTELDLPAAQELHLTRPAPGSRAQTDPFLGPGWT